jgi:Flp pilus assembly protein TadB
VTGEPTGEAALAAIQANAEMQAQWRMAVLAADTELERAYLDDRRDARARDVALAQAGRHNRRADLMVLFDVIGLIACLAVLALFRKEIPAEVVTLLSTIASLFGVCLRDAHQFEFGSSRGSREKDVLLGSGGKPPS